MKPRNFEVGDMKLKIGERVRVYSCAGLPIGPVSDTGMVEALENGLVFVACDNWNGTQRINEIAGSWFHPKQVRRLKKRERRRVWIYTKDLLSAPKDNDSSMSGTFLLGRPSMPQHWTEFIEARPKKARG